MISKLQLAALKSIQPNQLKEYLSANGWHEEGAMNKVAIIWRHDNIKLHEYAIVQPLRVDFADYKLRTCEAITTLSELEKRGFIEISNDINNFPADNIKIKITNDIEENGTIPLNNGIALFNEVNNLLLATTKSALAEQETYPDPQLDAEASRIVNTLRLAHSEDGCHEINIIAPISPQQNNEPTPRIAHALAKGLSTIKQPSNITTHKKDLCNAIIKLGGKDQQNNIQISILPSKARQIKGMRLTYSFSKDDIAYLKETTELYATNKYSYDNLSTGTTTHQEIMAREPGAKYHNEPEQTISKQAMIQIRPFKESDWDSLWQVIEPIFRSGETYPLPTDITKAEAYKAWIEAPLKCYVAINDNNSILGSYYIKGNQPGLGSHVCNCGYIVSSEARGKGIASSLCEHSQQQAISHGFKSMQYNLVVSTNEAAIRLWKKHGFNIIGTLPGAFNHKKHGYVDALIMFKKLSPP